MNDKYPIDKFIPVAFWPMSLASQIRSKPFKALLVLAYPIWFALCLPVMALLLMLSLVMATWDSVNRPEP